MTLAQLLALLNGKKEEAKAIMNAAKAMGREPSEEELAKVETLTEEAKDLQGQIDAKREQQSRAETALNALDSMGAAPAARTNEGTEANAGTPVTSNHQDLAEQDPNAGFRTPREFMTCVIDAGRGRAMDQRLEPLAAVGTDEQRTNSNPDGGFAVPEGFLPNMLQLNAAADPTSGMETQIPMSAPTVNIPARVDKNHTESVTGGLRFYRRAEAKKIESSKMEMENIKMTAETMFGLAFATNEILTDSPISFAAILEQGFRDEAPSFILNEKLNGTGAGQFEGVLNSPAKITVAAESGQAAGSILGKNIVNMRSRIWMYNQAFWMANQDIIPQLMSAHIPGTNGDVAIFAPSLSESMPDMLLGRPIIFTDHMKALGTEGDLGLFNWSQYLRGEYASSLNASSIHVRFEYAEEAFRVGMRNDGRCWWRTPLTPKNGNTRSPFVTLATRA